MLVVVVVVLMALVVSEEVELGAVRMDGGGAMFIAVIKPELTGVQWAVL